MRGYAASRKFRLREGHLRVPFDHVEGGAAGAATVPTPLDSTDVRQPAGGNRPALQTTARETGNRAPARVQLGDTREYPHAKTGAADEELPEHDKHAVRQGSSAMWRPGRGFLLGHWISKQRRAYAAGTLTGKQIRRLTALGMVWDHAEAQFEEGLAAARAYYAEHHTLAAPQSATVLDKQVGTWLSHLRRPGVLAGHPERAAALAAIDPDWNPAWPLVWQRHYAGVRESLASGAQLDELVPGVTIHGHDIGRWLEIQRQPVVWRGLTAAQRERLTQLGIEPFPAPKAEAGRKAAVRPSKAFERGLAALRQYHARTGSVTVPRGHVEALEPGSADGAGEDLEGVGVKLGVWLSNTKSRWAGLTDDQRERLTQLGIEPAPTAQAAAAAKAPQKAAERPSAAFQRGLAALRQYQERTGSVTVPRGHVEALDAAPEGGGEPVEVKLGVWLSNTKARRAKLTADQLDQLAEAGLDWR